MATNVARGHKARAQTLHNGTNTLLYGLNLNIHMIHARTNSAQKGSFFFARKIILGTGLTTKYTAFVSYNRCLNAWVIQWGIVEVSGPAIKAVRSAHTKYK